MTTLSKLIQTHQIKISNKYGAPANPNFSRDSNGWTVTLKKGRRTMTVPFYQGPAISGEPTIAGVLECLLLDASSAENASSFEDWASDFGFDVSESGPARSAQLKTFRACERISTKLQALLGDAYEDFQRSER